jgi:ATP-dependent RNA helicase DHX37/DHR1
VRYRSCAAVDEDVFLHPNSALHAQCPEFVAYTELVRTAKRPYMAGGWGCGWHEVALAFPWL